MTIDHKTRTQINIGDRAAPLVVKINRRAKRLIVKVDQRSGEIIVTAPSARAVSEAIEFAHNSADWIADQFDDRLRARAFAPDQTAPFRGEAHLLERTDSLRAPTIRITGEPPRIQTGGAPKHFNRRICDWMRKCARAALTEKSDEYCARLGVKRGQICIRDARTRWGSCSHDGALSYSWRLIMAPPAILDYVAAHECAHLVHMDHSRAFWRLLDSLGVDARAAADWFKTHGGTLFAYGIEPS
ncbi:MAG: SprT family zinc-dependent metalloprotease [Pseudomonadota bacterium]